MKPKGFFRSPLLWIVLGFLAIALIFEAVGNVGGYVDKPTSEVVALINSDTPLTEVILTDGEQSIKVRTGFVTGIESMKTRSARGMSCVVWTRRSERVT